MSLKKEREAFVSKRRRCSSEQWVVKLRIRVHQFSFSNSDTHKFPSIFNFNSRSDIIENDHGCSSVAGQAAWTPIRHVSTGSLPFSSPFHSNISALFHCYCSFFFTFKYIATRRRRWSPCLFPTLPLPSHFPSTKLNPPFSFTDNKKD